MSPLRGSWMILGLEAKAFDEARGLSICLSQVAADLCKLQETARKLEMIAGKAAKAVGT